MMIEKTTVSVLIPAAGCGTRTGLSSNKVLAPLHGRPLLWWTMRALLHPAALPPQCRLAEIVIAARHEEWDEIRNALDSLNDVPDTARFVRGGVDRQSSVGRAAQAARGDLLLVHDAARPLLAPAVMNAVCAAALETGAAIAALPCSDTIKRAAPVPLEGAAKSPQIQATVDRSGLWLAQTPQVFERSLFIAALEHAEKTGFRGTDCASLLEHHGKAGERVRLVEGDPFNFKVTYAADLERAERLLTSSDEMGSTF